MSFLAKRAAPKKCRTVLRSFSAPGSAKIVAKNTAQSAKTALFLYPFFAEFFYQAAGGAGEVLRQVYFYFDVQVAALAPAGNGHAFAFYLEHFAVGDTRGDVNLLRAVERLYFVRHAQKRIGEFDRQLGEEVRPVFFKQRVLRHVHLDVQVAGGAARDRLAHARKPYHLAAVDAGRDRYLYLALLFVDALAAAGPAPFFRDFALSAAVLARRHHGDGAEEGVGRFVDLARAVAVRTGNHLRAQHGARALAGVAHAGLGQKHSAFDPEDRFAEADFQVDGDVAPTRLPRGARTAAEDVRKDVAHVKAPARERILELGKVKPAGSALEPAKASRPALAASAEHAAVADIFGAALVVGQHAVRLGHLFKLFRVTLFFVGMKLVRKLVERFFYLFFGSTLLHSEQSVIVALV